MNATSLCTLHDVKDLLKISQTNTDDDATLEAFIMGCSRAAETNVLKRKIRAADYTEYHVGDGRAHLFVRNPPINSITSIHVDELREWTTGEITSDYYTYDAPYKEQGRIQCLDGYGFDGSSFTNVRVIYNGGFDEFVIVDGENDRIDWYDEDGGSLIQTSLTAATYTAATLATHIGAAMTLEASGDTVVCSYNATTGKFKIVSDGNDHSEFILAWTGTNAARSVGPLIGFDVATDDSAALTYTADYAKLGIPEDIQLGVQLWVAHLYVERREGRYGVKAKNVSTPGTGTTYELLAGMPDQTKALLGPYRDVRV